MIVTQKATDARNRANAQKSTGPKTRKGKAVSSQNARRHGLTSRPDPTQVLAWLGLILNEPKISLEALFPTDDRGLRALALAQAEANLVEVECRQRELRYSNTAVSQVSAIEFLGKMIQDHLSTGISPSLMVKTAIHILRLAESDQINLQLVRPSQHQILRRYVAEARSRRRKAFAEWISGST